MTALNLKMTDNVVDARRMMAERQKQMERNIDDRLAKASNILLRHTKAEIRRTTKKGAGNLQSYFKTRRVTVEIENGKKIKTAGIIGVANHPAAPYAAIQDLGNPAVTSAKVRFKPFKAPTKKGKKVYAVPTKAMRTASGTARGFARQVIAGDFPNITGKFDKIFSPGKKSRLPSGLYGAKYPKKAAGPRGGTIDWKNPKVTMLFRYLKEFKIRPKRFTALALRKSRRKYKALFKGILSG